MKTEKNLRVKKFFKKILKINKILKKINNIFFF